MAIGDAVAVFLGTGTVNRQPAAGVEEQISMALSSGDQAGNHISHYDGTTLVAISAGGTETRSVDTSLRNMALMITNSLYLRKPGTVDRWYISGAQTNV